MKLIGIVVGIILGIITYFVLTSVTLFINSDTTYTYVQKIALVANLSWAVVIAYYITINFIKWFIKYLH